jgi:type I restriction enzyme S subunit
VLLCIIRHLKVAIVPKGIDGANLTQGTVRLRPSDAITGPYLAAYLESPAAQGWMKERYFGMAMPRINVEDARAIPVPVAPIEEQQEITRRIARHEQYRVRVVAEVKAALAEAARLDQSVLAKAFRGELVDQDPADEPATVLGADPQLHGNVSPGESAHPTMKLPRQDGKLDNGWSGRW